MDNSKDKKQQPKELKKLFIHSSIIALLVVLGAGVAHFGLIAFTRHNTQRLVPEFKGLIITEAQSVAERNDLKIVINDSLHAPMYDGGLVLDQLPKAGVGVKPGRTIYVTINAFGAKKVKIPYVAGRSLRQAKNMLEAAGLQIERLVYVRDIATNYVLSEYYNDERIYENSNIESVMGSGITLHVGMKSDEMTTRMPELIGMTLREAKSRLWEVGLNVGEVTLPADATVFTRDKARVNSQNIPAEMVVSLGRAVSIKLSFDN